MRARIRSMTSPARLPSRTIRIERLPDLLEIWRLRPQPAQGHLGIGDSQRGDSMSHRVTTFAARFQGQRPTTEVPTRLQQLPPEIQGKREGRVFTANVPPLPLAIASSVLHKDETMNGPWLWSARVLVIQKEASLDQHGGS